MGVKLQGIIDRKEIEFSRLEGKIIAVDAPNIIFSLFNFTYKNKIFSYENMMMDRTQRAISHLYGILYRINFYYSKKIFPIFCFDGKVSDLKRIETKDYLHDFKTTFKRYEIALEYGNREIMRQIAMGREFLWPNIIMESKKLLGALGVPYFDSPASAESQCAHLVKKKIAHYSNSQDFDSLLFGCPKTIQNLSKSLKRKIQGKWIYKKIAPIIIDLKQNLKTLGVDIFQLVDIALLVGTDYFPGIKGIGAKIALKLLRKHHSLENVIYKERENYDFSLLTLEIIKRIRKIFLLPDITDRVGDMVWGYPDQSKVLELMCEDHTLNRERVENNVMKVINNYLDCRSFFAHSEHLKFPAQTTLDRIF
ncbi:MAG: hypothetical protein ACFFAH_08105 [Promethearchaeota archaeon]